jgi:uncharacterized membrane protein
MQNMSGGKTALGLDNNVGALVCYLNICLPFGFIYSIIVLVTDKTNKLPRFHAIQSLLLSAATFILVVIIEIFGAMVTIITRSMLLGSLIYLALFVVCIAVLAAVIFAAIKAYGGQIFKIPVIGEMADKWSN